MQRIFSARLDESTLDEMERVTKRLKMTKKLFLEEAIHRRALELSAPGDSDVWADTLGAWKRTEKPETTIRKAREAFRQTFDRNPGIADARVRR